MEIEINDIVAIEVEGSTAGALLAITSSTKEAMTATRPEYVQQIWLRRANGELVSLRLCSPDPRVALQAQEVAPGPSTSMTCTATPWAGSAA